MTRLALLRHGWTLWNQQRRLQGRSDIPLSAAGRRRLHCRRPPADWQTAHWHVSPLRRARETAMLLGAPRQKTVEMRLIEMRFGIYEGHTLAELRDQFGVAFRENEQRGLDFTPPKGESPRQVQRRLRPWLHRLQKKGGRHIAVTHKGVIRALLSLAWDWPMLGRQPVRLDWECMHIFRIDRNARIRPERVNVSLQKR